MSAARRRFRSTPSRSRQLSRLSVFWEAIRPRLSRRTSTHFAEASPRRIPIIFVVGSDPVDAGLVKSLSRPRENLTGMYLYIGGLLAKKLELLREVAPAVDDIGLVVNPGTPSAKLDTAEWAAVVSSSGKPSARISAISKTPG